MKGTPAGLAWRWVLSSLRRPQVVDRARAESGVRRAGRRSRRDCRL